MLSDKLIQSTLRDGFNLSAKDLAAYKKKADRVRKSLMQYVIDESIVDETEFYTAIGNALETPFVTLKGKEIPKDVLNLIPAPLAQTHQLIAFGKDNSNIDLAMLDPEDIQTVEFIQRKTGLYPRVHLTTQDDVKDALRRYHADLDSDAMIEQLADDPNNPEGGELKKAAEELPIINIVNSILEHAVYENASDIHIEPQEKEVAVRYRVDGILRQVMTLPKTVQSGIIARIKILATLKIDEHMVPQDGRFKIKVQEEKLSFRVSIMPVYDGEKIVMRLLHEGRKALTLEQLGFQESAKADLQRSIEKPHGMILVTGPTGSGKSTSLYSVLGILNTPDVNISTIEDPVEYHVTGINQSQVNNRAGYTFSGGLRAFLRQDPDIIMVGEIRDQETAEIAMHAAMTGHLVLSTLHTNTAVGTVARLLDMGIPSFLLASTLNIVVGQRLVRRLDPKLSVKYKLTAAEVEKLSHEFNPDDVVKHLRENGLAEKGETSLEKMTFFRPDPEKSAGGAGYKGRMGIYEVFPITPESQVAISGGATSDELQKMAEKAGMVTLFQDGMMKAKSGITSIEEVLRVTRE